MNDTSLEAAIASAEAYESVMVPALFEDWVGPVMDAAEIASGHHVLDVACGTGVLARSVAGRVGPTGRVVGVDPSPGMLSVAARTAPSVEWHEGVAEALPVPDRSFDAVVSQFGMMFFDDRLAALREMLRVVKPGGHVAIAVWCSLERSPAYALEVALVERIAGTRAADALRAPFVLGDRDELVVSFQRAGVASVRAETRIERARFASVRTMVEADLRGWLPVMDVHLSEHEIDGILAAADVDLARFVDSDGSVVFDSPAHIVTGMRPE